MLLDFKHTQQIFADLFFWYLVWGWSLHSDSLTYGWRKLVYIKTWHFSKIWYILSQNKQKNFVAYIDTQTGPRSPGHSSCLKDLFVILFFYGQWQSFWTSRSMDDPKGICKSNTVVLNILCIFRTFIKKFYCFDGISVTPLPPLEREDRLRKHPFAGFGTVMEDIKRSAYTKNQPILLASFWENAFFVFYIVKSIARKGYFGPKYP